MTDPSWTSTRTALPARGQPVQFLLDGRQFPLVGIYAPGGFRSRWSCYSERRVRLWRSIANGTPALPDLSRRGAYTPERDHAGTQHA